MTAGLLVMGAGAGRLLLLWRPPKKKGLAGGRHRA